MRFNYFLFILSVTLYLSLSGCQDKLKETPGLMHYNLAVTAQVEGKYDISLVNFKTALERNFPHRQWLYFGLGLTYMFMNKLEPAAEAFRNSLKLDPADQEARYNLCLCLLKLKKYQECLDTMKTVKDKYSDKREFALIMALGNHYLGNLEEALDYYLKALTEETADLFAFNLGHVYYYLGRYEEAAERLNVASSRYPQNFQCRYLAIRAREKLISQPAWETDLFQEYRTLSIDFPDNPLPHYHLGDLYERQGKYEEAINEYEKTLARGLTNASLFKHLGNLYAFTRNNQAAIRNLEKSLELDPDQPDVERDIKLLQRVID